MNEVKKWYRCPHCGQKILKYGIEKAKSKKVYIKCKKCNEEIEIIIE